MAQSDALLRPLGLGGQLFNSINAYQHPVRGLKYSYGQEKDFAKATALCSIFILNYKHNNIHKSYFPVVIFFFILVLAVSRKLCAINSLMTIAECQLLHV